MSVSCWHKVSAGRRLRRDRGRVFAIDRACREPLRNLKRATGHNFDLTQSMQPIGLPSSRCNTSFVFSLHANKKRQEQCQGDRHDGQSIDGTFRLRNDLRAMRRRPDRPRIVRVRGRAVHPPSLALQQLRLPVRGNDLFLRRCRADAGPQAQARGFSRRCGVNRTPLPYEWRSIAILQYPNFVLIDPSMRLALVPLRRIL